MSDMRDEMLRTLDRIVADVVNPALRDVADGRAHAGAGGAACDAIASAGPLWSALAGAGVTEIAGCGDDGDVSFADAMALVRRAAYHALPVPLGEAIVARRIAARSGLELGEGGASFAPPDATKGVQFSSGRLEGTAGAVPGVRTLAQVLVAAGPSASGRLVLARVGEALVQRSANMAGDARDTLDLSRAVPVADVALADAAAVLALEGALLRAVQMAGALDATLEHCLTWVNDRIQFGRPIGKHQAVQHLMAQLAEEVAAAGAAADFAVETSTTAPDTFAIAVAKSRVGEAAGRAATIAHAIFGAMGFTREHTLHLATRRLWSWRNEFGGESHWQGEVGRMVAAEGGARLWSRLTATG